MYLGIMCMYVNMCTAICYLAYIVHTYLLTYLLCPPQRKNVFIDGIVAEIIFIFISSEMHKRLLLIYLSIVKLFGIFQLCLSPFFAELRVCLSWSEAGCPTPTCVRVSRGRLQMSSNRECQPEPGHIRRIRSWKNRKHKVHSSKYCLFLVYLFPPYFFRERFK